MEKAKRRIHICLLCLIITAVILGILYYYNEIQKESTNDKGILVSATRTSWEASWK